MANPQGSAHISLNHLRYQGKPVPEIVFDASLAQKQLQTTLTAFQDMLNASFDVVLTPELPYQVELVMEHADLERLFALATDMEEISGSMTGKVRSEGILSDLRQLSGEVTLSDLSLNIAGQTFSNTQPIDLVMTQQKLVVNSFELQGEKLRVFSTGFVDFQGESHLDLDGVLDLRLIQPFLPATLGISSLTGRIHLLGTVVGSLKDPSLLGIAEIHHGRIRSSAYPDPITNINGRVTLAQGKIAIPRLVGRVSQGDVVVHGELAYSDGMPNDFTVKITGERLMLKEVIESLELTISPSLTLSGNLDKQVLAGNLVIHEALYNQDLDTIMSKQGDQERSISLITADTFNPSQSTPAKTQPMTLDLALKTANDIQVRNKQAVLDLRADLRIRGSPARPQLTGLVEVIKGGFYLFNVRYDVLSARFDFFDPRRINPELNILLETLIQQYTITVGLEGNLDRLSLNTSSDPFLSENEILSLLLRGAGRHFQIVQGPILGWIEDISRNLFDLDRVTLETTPLALQGRGGQAGPTLTLVKRLFDKLLLTYITSVGGAEKFQAFKGEYEFTEKLSAEIRGNDKGDMETDVMYEFRMK